MQILKEEGSLEYRMEMKIIVHLVCVLLFINYFSLIYSFNQQHLFSYFIPGNLLTTTDTKMNKIDTVSVLILMGGKGRGNRTMNYTIIF